MSDLKVGLEREADAGVAGVVLLPLRAAGLHRRARVRGLVAVLAGACVLFAAIAVAASLRPKHTQHPRTRLGSELVADASYDVQSESMVPTLEVGNVVSGATQFETIERGDVVRVQFPPSGATAPAPPDGDAGFKRVVGLPGETLEGRDGHVFVNGRQLAEPYLGPDVYTSDFAPVVVGSDSYYLLGDNRSNSKDSRVWGPVPRSTILAVALQITAPADRAGPIAGSPRSHASS